MLAAPFGLLPGGTMLGLQYPLGPRQGDASFPDSLVPHHVIVKRISLRTGLADSIMAVAGMRQRYALVQGSWVARNPFHALPIVRTDGANIFVADRLSYEIRVYSPEGRLHRIIRRALAGNTAESERAAYEQRAFPPPEPGPDSRGIEEHFRLRKAVLDYPDRLPPFGGMIVDETGRLWVADYRPPRTPRGVFPRFTVFGTDGAIVGTATLPDTVNLYGIGHDYMIFREMTNDAQYIRVRPLIERR
jgi:hypothetical protein